MKTRFELSILQPKISACSETPENMLPHELGKFCLQCNKAVHDLKEMTADALIDYLQKHEGESICATVKSNVLNKPVMKLNRLEPERAFQLKFIIILFLVFGPFLFSCNEKEHDAIKKAMEITVQDKGQAYLLPVDSPEALVNNIMFVTCGCVYEEEELIEITDNADTMIVLEPVYINYDRGLTEESNYDGGAISFLRYRSILEIDSVKTPEPQTPEINKYLPLNVFPNPASNNVSINYELKENGIAILSLFNINGQKINDLISTTNAETGNYSEQYNVSELPSGMYILILLNNDHKEVFRLSVTH